MRLVHAADIHLDSPLRGLSRLADDEITATLRAATRRALENLVKTVLDERAQILLVAGDLYDGNWPDYSTGRFFAQQMARLDAEGVRVFVVAGNHDAESEITRSLRLPPNVTVMDTAQPQTVIVEDLGVAVHGQGFATKAVMTNLAAGYPRRVPGLLNLGLLHTNVAGTADHAPYAPCALRDLTCLGYEYFALGHVHQQSVLSRGENTVAYSGNIQGRHPKETGPKGALIVDVEAGGVASVRARTLDVARWVRLEVAVGHCRTREEALDAVKDHLREAVVGGEGRPIVARVTLTGQGGVAAELAEAVGLDENVRIVAERVGVTVEQVVMRVRPPVVAESVEADLRTAIEAKALEWSTNVSARDRLRHLDTEVGRLLREADLLNLDDSKTLKDLTERAAAGLEALLGGVRP